MAEYAIPPPPPSYGPEYDTLQELFGVYGVGSLSPDQTTNFSENANSEFSGILYPIIDEKTCSSW